MVLRVGMATLYSDREVRKKCEIDRSVNALRDLVDRPGNPAYPCLLELYRSRDPIERMFCRLKDFRRVATRYEQVASNSSLPSASPQPSATGYESRPEIAGVNSGRLPLASVFDNASGTLPRLSGADRAGCA